METLITCKRCRSGVPVSELRSNNNASGWICLECYNKEHGFVIPESHSKPAASRSSAPAKYKCGSCGYEFTATFKHKLCPNCGEARTVTLAGGASASIVRDIDEMFSL